MVVGVRLAYAQASQRTHHHGHHRHRTVLPHRQPARRREPRRGLHPLGQARHQRRRPGQHLRRRPVPGPAAPGAARRPHPSRTRPVLRAQRAHRRPGDPQGAVRGRLHRPPPGHRLAALPRAHRTRRLHPHRTRPPRQYLDRGPRALAARPPALRALTGARQRSADAPAAIVFRSIRRVLNAARQWRTSAGVRYIWAAGIRGGRRASAAIVPWQDSWTVATKSRRRQPAPGRRS